MAVDLNKFYSLLHTAAKRKVSDIHLRTGERPCFREADELIAVKMDPYSYEEMKEICGLLIKDAEIKKDLDKIQEYDGSFELPKVCRVRFNILRYQNVLGIIMRIIPMVIPTLEELGIKGVLHTIAEAERGLILVTGATGQGKSSTLAAMINHINETKSVHIVTLEDPVEFLHVPKKSKVTQREIGFDTADFKGALRAALRQDPDVLLIGEMRDTETVDTALKAAETGHVVFATVHTTDALTTIGRILSMFPAEEQKIVRERLANNLRATVSQRLLPNKAKDGKVVAQEIMLMNPGIRDAIIGVNPMSDIPKFMEKSYQGEGGQTFDQHLYELYQQGKISLETAKAAASSARDFVRNLSFQNIDR